MSCLNLIDSDDSAILNLFSRNKSSLKMEQFVVFKSTVCTASTRKFKDVSVLSIVSAAARFFLENGHWVLIFWIFVDVKEEENHLAKSGKNRKKVQFLEPLHYMYILIMFASVDFFWTKLLVTMLVREWPLM